MTEASRRYDDPCGIARALNAVGERWGLLVVRELVYGPKRFSDLRRGLAGVSPNVLSQRLTELEREGVLRHRVAGPPVGSAVYELTDSGRGLIPVLDALARWGRQRPIASDRPLSRDALMFAMQTNVRPGAALPAGLRVTLDGTSWDPIVAAGTLDWRSPGYEAPAATLDTTSPVLHRLLFRGLPLATATAAGDATVAGDGDLTAAFLAAFERPATG